MSSLLQAMHLLCSLMHRSMQRHLFGLLWEIRITRCTRITCCARCATWSRDRTMKRFPNTTTFFSCCSCCVFLTPMATTTTATALSFLTRAKFELGLHTISGRMLLKELQQQMWKRLPIDTQSKVRWVFICVSLCDQPLVFHLRCFVL